MTDLKAASLRAHENNISRYHALLESDLSECERRSIKRHLHEETKAMEHLGSTSFSITLTSIRDESIFEGQSIGEC
jgi:hypothetical protein